MKRPSKAAIALKMASFSLGNKETQGAILTFLQLRELLTPDSYQALLEMLGSEKIDTALLDQIYDLVHPLEWYNESYPVTQWQ